MPSTQGVHDAVGWILENPEHLFIQVDTLHERELELNGTRAICHTAPQVTMPPTAPNLAGSPQEETSDPRLGLYCCSLQGEGLSSYLSLREHLGRCQVRLNGPKSTPCSSCRHLSCLVSFTGLRQISDLDQNTRRAYYWLVDRRKMMSLNQKGSM